jgi:hypothetical protein
MAPKEEEEEEGSRRRIRTRTKKTRKRDSPKVFPNKQPNSPNHRISFFWGTLLQNHKKWGGGAPLPLFFRVRALTPLLCCVAGRRRAARTALVSSSSSFLRSLPARAIMSVVNDFLPNAVAATVTATTMAIVFAPLAAAFVLGGGKNPPPPKSMVWLKRARESVVWAWNRVRSFWYTVHAPQHTAHTPQQLAARPIANMEPSRLNPAADFFYNKVPDIDRTLPNLQIRADPPRGEAKQVMRRTPAEQSSHPHLQQ